MQRMRNTVELRKNKTDDKMKRIRNIGDSGSDQIASEPNLDIARLPEITQALYNPDEQVQERRRASSASCSRSSATRRSSR